MRVLKSGEGFRLGWIQGFQVGYHICLFFKKILSELFFIQLSCFTLYGEGKGGHCSSKLFVSNWLFVIRKRETHFFSLFI